MNTSIGSVSDNEKLPLDLDDEAYEEMMNEEMKIIQNE